MPGGCLIAVLVFLHLLVLNEVGDIDEHAARIYLAAADILVERIEDLVNLN
jgi:hypothetical protein